MDDLLMDVPRLSGEGRGATRNLPVKCSLIKAGGASHSLGLGLLHAALTAALIDADTDVAVIERDKIRDAIRADFVLSAEIIVIELGTVADTSFDRQILTLSTVAIVVEAYPVSVRTGVEFSGKVSGGDYRALSFPPPMEIVCPVMNRAPSEQ